ncbi:MAG: PAS domain S-box protein [Pseudomonadota bacterium]
MENFRTELNIPDSSTKLAKMAQIFHLLGTDCKKNIDIILEQTCDIFDCACSLYNRIDDQQKSLVVWAGKNLPDDLDKTCDPTGHICWEATIKGENKPVVIEDIKTTDFYISDPYVQKYNLKSYLGFPVKCNDQVIGSLCIVDTKKREFINDDIHCIQTLAASLSLEEERLALENKIHEEKERYQILVENANDAIYIIQDGMLKFANQKTAQISGYTIDELKNTPFGELIHPDDRDLVKENYFRRLKGEDIPSTYSFKAISKNGDTIHIQINAARILWEDQPAILYFSRDISHVKELEEKLIRAEKMELIGTLAGGVAHDLNNILSGLVSYPELLLMQLEKDSPLTEPITFMLESGLKAADIVQDLLTLTRRGVSMEQVTNLNRIAHEYFHSTAHKRLVSDFPMVVFNTNFDPDLLNIKGSPAHITKIIMNLVINAAESVDDADAGVILVETYNQYIDFSLSGNDTILEGDYVVLKVTDNGAGIPEPFMNQIFEPFFTKKHMGRSGSGLGLSVVWNSVKDHHGYIEVRGRKTKGSIFEVCFPATREEIRQEAGNFNIDDFKGNNESILVIDDIKEQRKIARDVLELLGYHAITVATGEKAVSLLENYIPDLLLLDMKMEPGMDGLETYQKILAINPSQKAIIASGFSESDRVKEALRIGAGQYIRKPYTIKNLAHALKKELHP